MADAITLWSVKGQSLTPEEQEANINYLLKNPDGILIPSTGFVGVKLDVQNPDYGWEDMRGDIYFEIGSPNEPTFEVWNGNIKKRKFDVNDECFVTLHVTHLYARGTDIFFHIHWSHNVFALTTGAPTFVAEGTYAKGHNQQAFGVPISVTISEPASTTRLQHMVTEVQLSNAGGTDGLLDTADIEVDGVFELRVYLASNTMDDGAKPFWHTADGHNQVTGVATKNRTPNFYGTT